MRLSNHAAAVGLALLLTGPALAQLPPGVYAGEHDYRLAPAGDYAIDPNHTAVLARYPTSAIPSACSASTSSRER